MRTILVCGGQTRGEIIAGLRPRLSIESCLPPKIPVRETMTFSYGSDSNGFDLATKLLRTGSPGQHVPFYRRFTEKRRRDRRK